MSKSQEAMNNSLIRALVLSLGALVVPVIGAVMLPEAWDDYEALLWLLALVPAFLLAYYRGWRGVATALAAGMAVLSLTYAVAQTLGRTVPSLLFAVVIVYLAISLLVGWLAERLRKDRAVAPAEGAGAFTDPVTGLPNASHADLHLELEFNAAQRGRSLTVVYFDLDRLKAFNTRLGQAAGDDALRVLSGLLTQNTRRLNLSARYADDEFISVLGGSDENGSIIFVSRILNAWQEAGQERELPSLSVGIASYRPTMNTAADLVGAAAEAVRRAKKEGEGRVRVHGRATAVSLEAAKAAEEERPKAEVRTAGRKALVVVDDSDARSLLANYLNEQGFSVSHVSNVVDGVQCLSTEYDVLLTDISLTEGTGAELVRAAQTRWPSMQTIGLINLEDGNVSLEALNAGFDRFIEKPIDLSALRHHLSDLLARRDRLVTTVLESRQLSLEMGAQRTEAVNALKRTEAEYQSVVETLHAVIFRISEDGVWTFLNLAWTDLTGHGIEDSVGRAAADYVHPDDRATFIARHKLLISREIEEARDQVRLLTRDNSVVWIELRARRISDPDSGEFVSTGTLTDVTRTKAAEEKLRRREAASRALLEALPDEVFGLSPGGVFLNFGGVQSTHATSIVGRSLEDVFDPAIAANYRDAITRLFETRDVQVIEYPVTGPDGLDEYEARLALIGADEIVVIVRNISDRRRLEEQLRQSQKLEAIGRLAGGLAHDFNNLLTVVQGNTHFLQEEVTGNESAQECVEHISRAAQRGADLIRQLLAFSRRQVLQPRVIDLGAVITTVQPMLARLLGEGIVIDTAIEPDLGLVRADPGQIEQVIVSLATFSKTRLPAGGNLRLSARNLENGNAGTEPDSDASAVVLEVSDDGPRLDEKARERIFEPFFGTIKAGHTHGIGLASVYGIVTQSGGAILLDEAAEVGISFRIILPRVESPVAARAR